MLNNKNLKVVFWFKDRILVISINIQVMTLMFLIKTMELKVLKLIKFNQWKIYKVIITDF